MQLDLEISNEEDSSLDLSERQNLTRQQISKIMNRIDEAIEFFFQKTIMIAKEVQKFLVR